MMSRPSPPPQPKPVAIDARYTSVSAARARREIDGLALAVALLCVGLAWTAQHHLNADGVSYLDLAVRLREGDWSSFVQGYWSPLYPALLAVAGVLTGAEGAPSLPVVHGLNALTALAVVARLWRAFRRRADVLLARLGFAALLLCGTRPPRVDAVTPDLLLLLVLLLVALEWLEHGGRRWVRLGLALGIAFLVKTSTWPWLAAVILASVLLAARAHARRPAVLSGTLAVGVALLWIVPLSVREGRLSLGSAGRLNWCWYLAGCDTRSPDTYRGEHAAYRTVSDPGSPPLVVADFGDTPWTYAPWSDPTAWDRGVRSRRRAAPGVPVLLDFWGRNTVIVVGFWLAPLLLAVVVPALLTTPQGPRRGLSRAPRPVLLAIVLGEIGILQFIAVHVEPRLIAPFALLLALGILWWRRGPTVTGASGEGPVPLAADRRRFALSVLGLAVAVPFTAVTLRDQIRMTARLNQRLGEIERLHTGADAAGFTLDRIAVVGPALPHLTDAWRVGGRIVAQIPPASAEALARMPSDRVRTLLSAVFAGRAGVVWVHTGGQSFRMLRVDDPPQPAGASR